MSEVVKLNVPNHHFHRVGGDTTGTETENEGDRDSLDMYNDLTD